MDYFEQKKMYDNTIAEGLEALAEFMSRELCEDWKVERNMVSEMWYKEIYGDMPDSITSKYLVFQGSTLARLLARKMRIDNDNIP